MGVEGAEGTRGQGDKGKGERGRGERGKVKGERDTNTNYPLPNDQ